MDHDKLHAGLNEDQRRRFVKSCPRNVFMFQETTKNIEIENPTNCSLCQECVKYAQDSGIERGVKIGEHDFKILFTVESSGALEADAIVVKAMKILQSKLTTLHEQMSKYAVVQHM